MSSENKQLVRRIFLELWNKGKARRGTRKGDFLGIAPTNKEIKVERIVVNRISRGRIA